MRLLIASDLHGSLESLHFLLEKMHELQPDKLLLLGDLVYHGPRNPFPKAYDTLSTLHSMPDLTKLPCPVLAVRGNCDAEVDLGLLPFKTAENMWISCDGLDIFICHGHRLPERPPCPGFLPGTVFLRGHTHIPRAESIDGMHFWNPGSLSLPKTGWPRSYGVYEQGTFHVLDMQGKEIMRHSPQA
jgi:putative phosphoesterase